MVKIKNNDERLKLRLKLIKKVEENAISIRRAAAEYKIPVTTAIRWVYKYKKFGQTLPQKRGKPKGSVLDKYSDFIFSLAKKKPRITLREIAHALLSDKGLKISLTMLSRWRREHMKKK